jgi:hypothetical protein
VPLCFQQLLMLCSALLFPEREPRVSLAEAVTEAVNSLKFDRTRGLFDDLRVPASQRDYILGQMTVIAARKTPSPVEHDMADLVKRAGDGFVNLGEAGMSWSVLYKMEREAFGEARSETAKAYADRVQQMRDARAPVVVGAGVIALFGISGALCLALLANRMRRRAKRIEGLFRDVRAMQDNFAEEIRLSRFDEAGRRKICRSQLFRRPRKPLIPLRPVSNATGDHGSNALPGSRRIDPVAVKHASSNSSARKWMTQSGAHPKKQLAPCVDWLASGVIALDTKSSMRNGGEGARAASMV